MEQVPIPRVVAVKLLNRHRRLSYLRSLGGLRGQVARGKHPGIEREERLRDEALDQFCAWAEEHAPSLFYTEKG